MTKSAKTFLDTIFDGADGEVMVCRLNTGSTGGMYQVRANDPVFTRWQKSKSIAGAWFFCISTVKDTEETVLRRRKQDVVETHCLVLDDIGTKVTKKIPLEPSWVIETSPKNYQYGYILEQPEDKWDVEATLRGLAADGWTDGQAIDMCHVFRVPGSANQKEGRRQFEARITKWKPKRRFTLESIRQGFGTFMIKVPKKEYSSGPITDIGDVEIVDDLLLWMYSQQMVLREENGLIKVNCPNAARHTDGNPEATYFPLGWGDIPEMRGFHCFHEHCAEIKIGAWLEHCMELGAPPTPIRDPLPWLQKRYVVVASTEAPRIYDLDMRDSPLGAERSLQSASMLEGFVGSMVTPDGKTLAIINVFKSHPDTVRVENFWYDPTTEDALISVKGKTAVNTYVPIMHEETDAEPVEFLHHVERLIPDRKERDLFLDWLAYKLQNPGKRSYAVMMVTDGVQGTGRGILGNALQAVWGEQARIIDLKQLLGIGYQNENYNSWMPRTQLVITDEAKDVISREDAFHAYETFKQTTDTRPITIGIKRKGVNETIETIYYNALIFSNHLDPMVVPPEDRRIFVIRNPDKSIRRDEGHKIAVRIEKETAAIFWWLKNRDVSKFEPANPLETEAKRYMIEMSKSPLDLVIEWFRDEENCPGDLLSQSKFKKLWGRACDDIDATDQFRKGMGSRVFTRFEHISGKSKGARLRFENGSLEYVRAVRNAAYWRDLYDNGNTNAIKMAISGDESGTGGTVLPFPGKGK